MKARFGRLLHLSDGQDLIEYALLIGLISVTLVITLTGLGNKVPGYYTTTEAAMPGGPADNAPDDGTGNPGRGGRGGRGGNPGNGNPGNDKPVGNGNPGSGKGK